MTRKEFVSQMQNWIGFNEQDGTHKYLIDIYNFHKPLARGYTVAYDDSWCAVAVSACAIQCKCTDIVPIECSCQKMIELAKNMNIWIEDDGYIPQAGDIVLYDWQDSGNGDNTGWADHIGVVEKCDGITIIVIEGNINNKVDRRNITVNGKYIRGYICPNFADEAENIPESDLKSIEDVAKDVINGKYGNGNERKKKLEAEGYDYATVQAKVNELVKGKSSEDKKSLDQVAQDVINGKYGNGDERKRRIPAETGYSYAQVQSRVNALLK